MATPKDSIAYVADGTLPELDPPANSVGPVK